MSYVAYDMQQITAVLLVTPTWLIVELTVFAYISDSDMVWPSMKPSGDCKK